MHNLHIVRVNAHNGDEAVSIVDNFINDTDSERFDFYNITSAIDEKGNVVYRDEDGRFLSYASLSVIKKSIYETYSKGVIESNEQEDLLNEAVKRKEWVAVSHLVDSLRRHKELEDQIDNEEFDLFKVVFNEFEWDRFGITDIAQYASDSKKVFLVLVDFHN